MVFIRSVINFGMYEMVAVSISENYYYYYYRLLTLLHIWYTCKYYII